MTSTNNQFHFNIKRAMKKSSINYFCAILVASVLFNACTSDNKEKQTKPVAQDSTTVFILQKQEVNKKFSFPSELTPLERAEIFAKVSGYIKKVKVDIGDKVQQGQVLAIIEAPEMLSNYAQASADVQFANSKYIASLDAFTRIENAAKVNGTVATGELEKSRNQMLADKAAHEATKAKLNAYAQLKDYLTIRSPFSGTIVQRNADIGTLVGTANNKPILVIENTATLRLKVPVQEAYTTALPDSSFISFTVDAQPDKKYFAKLSRKTGAINKDNRTETWEFIYNNSKQELKSGMYANATMKLGRSGTSFVVAPSAIATTLEKRFVIRLKDGKAEWIDVRNGMNTGDKIEIFGNLNEGDTLLMKATDEIKEGTKLIGKIKK
ncbi:efflux RND transporter periplasmic adaptor subunit [Sediminibacterium sp.]|uniref:efflux RND transporter periplasmic adaptor subunit n=1 Tax=Sediminibacterium sp. TaxID=1917865 RepID=UPI0025F96079|nr:efflux RND transporter periplasmic adaptor subunit [Sediminibacterium sp.]